MFRDATLVVAMALAGCAALGAGFTHALGNPSIFGHGDPGALTRVRFPGVEIAYAFFWVAVVFSTLLAVQRSFAIEAVDGGRDALRLSGLDPAGIFIGKAAAVGLQLALLEVALGIGVVVLYDAPLSGAVLLATTCVLATVGLAAAGTLFGVLVGGLRVRETLLPLLLLPVLAPLVLGATRATEYALAGEPANGWPWAQLLAVFAAVYTALGIVAFGPLLEES